MKNISKIKMVSIAVVVLSNVFTVAAKAQQAPPTVTPFKAEYIVPESTSESIPESQRRFEVSYYVMKNEDGSESAIFNLPQELTGQRVSALMTVTHKEVIDGKVVKTLEGPQGTAECTGPWAQTQCRYRFPKLKIDSAAVNDFLDLKYPTDLPRKLELKKISQIFGCDPIGEVQTEFGPSSVQPVAACGL